MEHEVSLSSPSLKQKLKSSLTPSCFPYHKHHHHHQSDSGETLGTPDAKSRLIRMSSNPWLKNRSHHHDTPELKDKCRYLISRIGGGSRHARRHSVDLHYDASSYALNFDDDDDKHLDEEPLRSFSSRLPQSPNREIKAL